MSEPTTEEKDYRKTIVDQHSELNELISKLTQSSSKNHFWTFNIGHALTVVVLIGGWLWYLSKAENRIANMEKAVGEIVLLVQKIDEHGTTASQRGIFQETELGKSTERRVTALEKVVVDMAPKLERIDTNLSWLMRNQKTQP